MPETPNPTPNMPNYDRISSEIPAQVVTDFNTKLNEALALIQPYEEDITNEERQRIRSIGPALTAWMERCLIHSAQTPGLISEYMDAAGATKDKTRRDQISSLITQVEGVRERLRDIYFLSNADLFDFCSMIHANARERARRGVPGADTIFADLQAHFPGRRRASRPTPVPAGE